MFYFKFCLMNEWTSKVHVSFTYCVIAPWYRLNRAIFKVMMLDSVSFTNNHLIGYFRRNDI